MECVGCLIIRRGDGVEEIQQSKRNGTEAGDRTNLAAIPRKAVDAGADAGAAGAAVLARHVVAGACGNEK